MMAKGLEICARWLINEKRDDDNTNNSDNRPAKLTDVHTFSNPFWS